MKKFIIFSLFLSACSGVYCSEQVSLSAFAGRYGFSSPDVRDDSLVYRSSYTEMEFKDKSRMLRYNGYLIWMGAGAFAGLGDWHISKGDTEKVLAPLLRSKDYVVKARKPGLVLIDPGHGGSDTGAKPGRGRNEEHLNLDVALRLQKVLTKKGIRSVLTRDRDVRLGLAARARKVGTLGADIMVSIHMNAAGNTGARGFETYLLPVAGFASTSGGKGSTKRVVGNRNDELNMLLAYLLHRDALMVTGAEDRGIKRARFDVLCNATCPAVLVECGFVSNAAENTRLQTADYRQSIAAGLAKGIENYYLLWK